MDRPSRAPSASSGPGTAALRRERNQADAERREAERRRRAEEEEAARRKRLDALIAKGESVWRTIEDEIGRRNAPAYDRAAGLLFDLQVIAAEQGTLADFARRVGVLPRKTRPQGKVHRAAEPAEDALTGR